MTSSRIDLRHLTIRRPPTGPEPGGHRPAEGTGPPRRGRPRPQRCRHLGRPRPHPRPGRSTSSTGRRSRCGDGVGDRSRPHVVFTRAGAKRSYADPTASAARDPGNPATDATIEARYAATTPTRQQLQLQVTGPNGAAVPVSTYRSGVRYDVDPGRLGRAVATFQATAVGQYQVSATGPPRPGQPWRWETTSPRPSPQPLGHGRPGAGAVLGGGALASPPTGTVPDHWVTPEAASHHGRRAEEAAPPRRDE